MDLPGNKFEARISKSETDSKTEIQNSRDRNNRRKAERHFSSSFEFVSDFEIRISDSCHYTLPRI